MNGQLHGQGKIKVEFLDGYCYEDFIPSNPTNPTDAVTHAEAHTIARQEVSAALATYITDAALRTALADYATNVALNALTNRLDGFVSESDYNLEKATLESRDADLSNRLDKVENMATAATPEDVATAISMALATLRRELQQALNPFTVEVFPKFVKPTRQALERTFALEFGKIYPPITTANRLIVTFSGSPIFNGTFTPADNLLIPLPVTRMQADNIATNTQPSWTLYDVQVRFRLNNDPADLAFYPLKVVIDRV